MDDTKQYTIQIKGTAYKFRPIPDNDLVKIQLIFNMNASVAKTLKAVTLILKTSVGDDVWDELTDRLIVNEISVEDLVSGPIKKLIERQVKDRKTAKSDD